MRAEPTLLRENREFRRFFTGQSISLVGDQITLIALPLTAVLVLDADAAQMGYLTAAALLPHLLFALHAGAWVDRRGHRRRTMIAADLGRALVIATVPVAYAFDVLDDRAAVRDRVPRRHDGRALQRCEHDALHLARPA